MKALTRIVRGRSGLGNRRLQRRQSLSILEACVFSCSVLSSILLQHVSRAHEDGDGAHALIGDSMIEGAVIR